MRRVLTLVFRSLHNLQLTFNGVWLICAQRYLLGLILYSIDQAPLLINAQAFVSSSLGWCPWTISHQATSIQWDWLKSVLKSSSKSISSLTFFYFSESHDKHTYMYTLCWHLGFLLAQLVKNSLKVRLNGPLSWEDPEEGTLPSSIRLKSNSGALGIHGVTKNGYNRMTFTLWII